MKGRNNTVEMVITAPGLGKNLKGYHYVASTPGGTKPKKKKTMAQIFVLGSSKNVIRSYATGGKK